MRQQAVIYARVSTTGQMEDGTSIPSQLEACRKYAEVHDMDVVQEFSEDKSGMKLERDGLATIRELVRAKQIDVLIVYSSDRFTRVLAHSILLREELKKHGVSLHYATRGEYDAESSDAKMMEDIQGTFNEYWRAKMIEASKRGKRHFAKQGKWSWGGPPAYGYVIADNEYGLSINEEEAKIIRWIFYLFIGDDDNKPMSMGAIIRLLKREGVPPPGAGRAGTNGGVWRRDKLKPRFLTRRQYIGDFSRNGITLIIPELAIVDQATWDAAQARCERNKHHGKRWNSKVFYLLSARFTCICGNHLQGSATTYKGKYRSYYRCNVNYRFNEKGKCTAKALRSDKVDEKAWNWLVDLIVQEEKLDQVIKDMTETAQDTLIQTRGDLAIIETELEKVNIKIERFIDAYGEEEDAEIAATFKARITQEKKIKQELLKHKSMLEGKIANAEITPAMQTEIKKLAKKVRNRLHEGGTNENKRDLFEALDVQAQLMREPNGEQWIKISCGLGRYSGEFCAKKPGVSAFG